MVGPRGETIAESSTSGEACAEKDLELHVASTELPEVVQSVEVLSEQPRQIVAESSMQSQQPSAESADVPPLSLAPLCRPIRLLWIYLR